MKTDGASYAPIRPPLILVSGPINNIAFAVVARSLRIHSDMLVARALKNSQLTAEKQPTDHGPEGCDEKWAGGCVAPRSRIHSDMLRSSRLAGNLF